MRILALQLKRIGDTVLTAPALAALRQSLPAGSRIEMVVNGPSSQVAGMFPSVDAVHCMHSGKWNVNVWKQALAGKWDAVLDFSGTDRSASLALVTRAPVRAGYTKDMRNRLKKKAWNVLCDASVRELHTIDFHHALVNTALAALQLQNSHVTDPGHLQLPANLELPELPIKYAVVHPGTARIEKYWPAQSWAEVITGLTAAHNLPVIITGSADPVEMAHVDEIHRSTLVWGNLAGKLDLTQLTGVLANARIVLGVDSAAMHLAAAFHRPQIALFGPTNPYHWRPRHDRARTLLAAGPDFRGDVPRHRKADMQELQPERVLAAAGELMQLDT
jgi:ADP-heptose:LPS heptosyltransferase